MNVLERLNYDISLCRLKASATPPTSSFLFYLDTDNGKACYIKKGDEPDSAEVVNTYTAFRFAGFSAEITRWAIIDIAIALKELNIPFLNFSTPSTNYIFIKKGDTAKAIKQLELAKFIFV